MSASRARRIAALPVPDALRRQLLGTARRWDLMPRAFRRDASGRVHARLLDYSVVAYSEHDLRFLFDEVFVEAPYLFPARRPAPLIVDAGRNIGFSVLFFKALYPGARTLAFEPGERAVALLRENVASNRLDDVEIHQLALGRDEGTVDLFVDPEDPGSLHMSTVPGRLSLHGVPVRQARLSTFLEGEVDFLKLDVEGAEEAVLEDLFAAGAIRRIERMVIEVHHHMNPARDALGDLLRRLEGEGFGYHLAAAHDPEVAWRGEPAYQDVLLSCYRK